MKKTPMKKVPMKKTPMKKSDRLYISSKSSWVVKR
jgi:hypothetical protein